MRDETKLIININKKFSKMETEIAGKILDSNDSISGKKNKNPIKKDRSEYNFFLSYCQDDNYDGKLSRLKDRFEKELKVVSGKKYIVFQDIKSIGWGENWRNKINNELKATPFLLPIITPSFFSSQVCCDELSEFIKIELKRKRDDLILPLYYVTVSEMEQKSISNELIISIKEHNYLDFRETRIIDEKSIDFQREIVKLAKKANDAIQRIN
jgi:hypothetical protein